MRIKIATFGVVLALLCVITVWSQSTTTTINGVPNQQLTFPGAIYSGSGSGVAGTHDFTAGTVPAIGANSFGIGVGPTMTTSQRLQSPNDVAVAHSLMVIGAPSSNISTWAYKAVPDCTDTGGNHLNFTQSTDVFSCGTSGGGSGPAVTSGGFTSLPGTCTHTSTASDIYYFTDSWWINALCTATNTWNYWGQYGLGTPADAISNWTGVNLSTNLTCTNSAGVTYCALTNTAGLNWRFYDKSIPSTPFLIDIYWRSNQAHINSIDSGIYFYDGTKMMGLELLTQSASDVLRVEKMTNVTTDSGTAASLTTRALGPNFGGMCGRLADDGSTLTFAYSLDCHTFTTLFSEAVGTFITPTKYGFGGVNTTATGNTMETWIPSIYVH